MYKVVGRRKTAFIPKDSNESINGYNLFLLHEQDGTEGYACERVFVSDRKFVNGVVPALDDFVDLRYNRYGKVDSAEAIPNGK